jgi:alkylation response protein AidB-like acyl-CoA dehydrogenase
MTGDLCLRGPERNTVAGFFEPRAGAVDRCEATVRDGIAFVQDDILAGERDDPNADLERVARTIATVAWSDVASAFSIWSHRMVLEYLARGERAPLERWGDALLDVELLGSTALSGPIAHHLGQSRVALTGSRDGAALVLRGKVRWASNLFVPEFVLVSAAVVDGELVTFVIDGAASGLVVDPYPTLVALQATGSSSLGFDAVRVAEDAIVSERFAEFVERVRPTFLVLQSSFCWGLARRSLDEAGAALNGAGLVFREDLDALTLEANRLAALIARAASARAATVGELVRARLAAARLASAATALEAKVVGSRSFMRDTPTARRLREAAFLPIQSPTEAQLRAEIAAGAAVEVLARP